MRLPVIGWHLLKPKCFKLVAVVLMILLVSLFLNLIRHAIVYLRSQQHNHQQHLTAGSDELDFAAAASFADNETGFPFDIVPDRVHYVRLEDPYLDFIMLISIKSVLKNHNPASVTIHCDCKQLRGKYWDKLMNETQPGKIVVKQIKRPVDIFGKKLSSVYHASDVARLQVLMRFGGIFLDNDVFVVKSLHQFRKFEFTLGWPKDEFLGTQVLIVHRNARFLKLWYDSYKYYRPTRWYYNAGELPTTKYLVPNPGLVHRVEKGFGVHNLVPMLYEEIDPWWEDKYFAVHLLARHRSYLVPRDSIKYFNEENIKRYNKTFGQMARSVLFGKKDLILE